MTATARNTLLATVATALLAGTAITARAQDDPEQPTLAIAFADAVEIARATVPGEPREAELDDEDGSPVWEIEMLATDGQAIELVIDATSGAVLSQEVDNDNHIDNDRDGHDDD